MVYSVLQTRSITVIQNKPTSLFRCCRMCRIYLLEFPCTTKQQPKNFSNSHQNTQQYNFRNCNGSVRKSLVYCLITTKHANYLPHSLCYSVYFFIYILSLNPKTVRKANNPPHFTVVVQFVQPGTTKTHPHPSR